MKHYIIMHGKLSASELWLKPLEIHPKLKDAKARLAKLEKLHKSREYWIESTPVKQDKQ